MTETTKIHEAMVAILADIPSIGKDQRNTTQGYQFRGIDQFLNALHPLFAKHGVYVTPQVEHVDRTERTNNKGTVLFYAIATVRFVFRASDGSYVDCVTVGEGMDSGDKATNKAMSAAYKYALMQTFAVPTEDMIDGDAESPEVAPQSDVGGVRDEQLAELRIYLDANGIDVADAERYCASLEYIDDGASLKHLTDKRLAQIVARLPSFGNKVIDYIADNPKDDGGTAE